MQITDVKTFLVHDRVRPERNYAFVKIYTDEGLTGLGEDPVRAENLYYGGSPGLGVELDEDAARAYPFRQPGLRVLRCEDNSVSDW